MSWTVSRQKILLVINSKICVKVKINSNELVKTNLVNKKLNIFIYVVDTTVDNNPNMVNFNYT